MAIRITLEEKQFRFIEEAVHTALQIATDADEIAELEDLAEALSRKYHEVVPARTEV